MVYEIT